jgi:methylglutaconyl-CoA hydratase
MTQLVTLQIDGLIAAITLSDPARRNALGLAMFDALDRVLEQVRDLESVHIVVLAGEGPAFCSGFDLVAAANDPALVGTFILRLSASLRRLRRLPQVVVASVHGAAIAGGCALLSTCDFTFIAPDAKLGYPVHRLGVSPAVTIPTLHQAIGLGPARALLMSGQLIDGRAAARLALATHLAHSKQTVRREALEFCGELACNGVHALRATKAWLNELDGSLDDSQFQPCANASAAEADTERAASMLRARWNAPRAANHESPGPG